MIYFGLAAKVEQRLLDLLGRPTNNDGQFLLRNVGTEASQQMKKIQQSASTHPATICSAWPAVPSWTRFPKDYKIIQAVQCAYITRSLSILEDWLYDLCGRKLSLQWGCYFQPNHVFGDSRSQWQAEESFHFQYPATRACPLISSRHAGRWHLLVYPNLRHRGLAPPFMVFPCTPDGRNCSSNSSLQFPFPRISIAICPPPSVRYVLDQFAYYAVQITYLSIVLR